MSLTFAGSPSERGPFYEVWFLKFNEPRTGDALWLRYLRQSGPRPSASCWYVLFERASRGIAAGRWELPFKAWRPGPRGFSLDGGFLEDGRCSARGEGAEWDFEWRAEPIAEFDFVPPLLKPLARSSYASVVPFALFSGRAVLGGREFLFRGAPGSVGRLRGRAMARRWLWAHACLRAGDGSPAALELLSAKLGLGAGLDSPWLTVAHLHYKGRHYQARRARDLFRTRSVLEGRRWSFGADFDGLCARGSFEQPEDWTAKVLYRDLDGSELCCRNSKTAALRLELEGPGGARESLETDAAAFEIVDRSLPDRAELDLA